MGKVTMESATKDLAELGINRPIGEASRRVHYRLRIQTPQDKTSSKP